MDGHIIRAWRRSRGWDVPETARRLRNASHDSHIPARDSLTRMIYRWERHGLTAERYQLLYAQALGIHPDDLPAGPPPPAHSPHDNNTASSRTSGHPADNPHAPGVISAAAPMASPEPEGGDRKEPYPSVISAMLAEAASGRAPADTEPLALILTGSAASAAVSEPGMLPDISTLASEVDDARREYQACRYSELARQLPGLLSRLDLACATLAGDSRAKACLWSSLGSPARPRAPRRSPAEHSQGR